MPGNTLGVRRLQTPFENLFPLRNALISHIGIIKQTGKNFIDSKGRIMSGRIRTLQGRVTSNKMEKSITVSIERFFKHSMYR